MPASLPRCVYSTCTLIQGPLQCLLLTAWCTEPPGGSRALFGTDWRPPARSPDAAGGALRTLPLVQFVGATQHHSFLGSADTAGPSDAPAAAGGHGRPLCRLLRPGRARGLPLAAPSVGGAGGQRVRRRAGRPAGAGRGAGPGDEPLQSGPGRPARRRGGANGLCSVNVLRVCKHAPCTLSPEAEGAQPPADRLEAVPGGAIQPAAARRMHLRAQHTLRHRTCTR